MSSEFDRFLSDALAPEEREPDRLFVSRVQARVRLEERLAAERRAVGSRLAFELAGIAAIAAALLVLAESPAVAQFAAQSPEIIVIGLLVAFGSVVGLFSYSGRRSALEAV